MRSGASALIVALASSGVCSEAGETPRAPSAPATLVAPTTAEDLATVKLPPESQRALGITTAAVEAVVIHETSLLAGEVLVPPGGEIVLAAPIGGRVGSRSDTLPNPGSSVRAGQLLLSLVPMAAVDRNARASADRDLEAARANYELSDARLERAIAMTTDGSGSQRNAEDARAQRQIAHAEMKAAESRLRTLAGGVLDADVALPIKSPVDGIIRAVRVAPGQSVPSGTALIDVAGTGRWIRARLTASDAHAFDEQRAARARRVGSDEGIPLAFVMTAPSADPLRGSIDRFFALPRGCDWTPGERVLVELDAAEMISAVSVPSSAVVRDAEGGAWVYEPVSADRFRRRRVEPMRRDGSRLLIARGLASNGTVVSAGAIELWGFELGADR